MKIFLVVIFLGLVLDAKAFEAKQVFNKKVVAVKKMELAEQKHFYAKTTLDESKIVEVTLRFSGYIEALYADEKYMHVQKGEKLFRIYAPLLAEIKEEIAIAKGMGQKSVVKSLEKKRTLLGVDERVSDAYMVDIKAPAKGTIITKNIHLGSFVKKGSPLYQIADMSRMWVVLQVPQEELAFVQEGMQATIMIEGLGQYKGDVAFIYPVLDSTTKMAEVRVEVDNPQGEIHANLFAKVTLHASEQTALILPKSAVLTKGEKHFVFQALENGEFSPLEVQARRFDSHTFVIEDGLKEGDEVIDRALFMLDADAMTHGLYETDDEDW